MTAQTALNRELIHVCRVIRITPLNLALAGEIGFTDHDCDLTIDSLVYKAKGTFEPTSAELSSNLTVDSSQLRAVFTDDSIDADLIARGFYDGATITISLVDWHDPPTDIEGVDAIVITKGDLGNVSVTNMGYELEARSIETKLNKSTSKLVQPFCPYALGDSDCTVDLAGGGFEGITATVTAVTARNEFTITAIATTRPYNYGIIEFTSGANNGVQREILNLDTGTFVVKMFESFPDTITIGDTVTITAGCDKTTNGTTGCGFYSNIVNFGGFPQGGNWMPGKDYLYSNPIDHA